MVEVMAPKPFPVGVPSKPVPGCEKYGWLKMLKNSVRNSTPIRSPILVFLNTAKSKLLIPGPRRLGSTRDSSPNPHCGGAAKQLVLKYWVRPPPPAFLSHPATTSGLTFATPKLPLSSEVDEPDQPIFSGKPFWKVVMPSTPQPETTPFASPLRLLAYIFPFPKGRSRT